MFGRRNIKCSKKTIRKFINRDQKISSTINRLANSLSNFQHRRDDDSPVSLPDKHLESDGVKRRPEVVTMTSQRANKNDEKKFDSSTTVISMYRRGKLTAKAEGETTLPVDESRDRLISIQTRFGIGNIMKFYRFSPSHLVR